MEWSYSLTQRKNSAGLITRLDSLGRPVIKGNNDLSAVKIVDVAGWAPGPDGLAWIKNTCTGKPFVADIDSIKQFSP